MTSFITTFKVAPSKTLGFGGNMFWGGGHTVETDPTRNGWKAATTSPEGRVVLVGQRGVAGCATIVAYPGGLLDVALYYECPEEIAKSLKETGRAGFDAEYVQIPDVSGCGLRVISLIQSKVR